MQRLEVSCAVRPIYGALGAKGLKANLHITCYSHAVTMLFPCHTVSFAFDLHSAAMFDSHMPCLRHAKTMLFRSDFSRPRHSTAWARHGTCELATAVQRQHVGDLPALSFF
jgi:hypothetical protein